MFRLLLIAACLAVSVNAYSEGAPKAACRDLTPQHGAELQTKKPPYSFSGPSHVRGDQKLTLTLGGDEFLGFMIQARDGQNRVVGQFNVLDTQHSQTLDCSGPQVRESLLRLIKLTLIISYHWFPGHIDPSEGHQG